MTSKNLLVELFVEELPPKAHADEVLAELAKAAEQQNKKAA